MIAQHNTDSHTIDMPNAETFQTVLALLNRSQHLELARWDCDICGMIHTEQAPQTCDGCGGNSFSHHSDTRTEINNHW